MAEPLTYEDIAARIDIAIEKQRYRWRLAAVPSLDWSDIAQELRIHIHKKLHLWDQTRELEPWLNSLIVNQIFNAFRDNYFGFAKPCTSCPFAKNQDQDSCAWTASGKQDLECPTFRKWYGRKRNAFNVKLPVSAEHHETEIHSIKSDEINLEEHFAKVNKHARRYLNRLEYKIYRMLYVKHQTEEDVAKMLGLKTNEKHRTAGYRQLSTYKQRIFEKIKKLIEKEDIIQ